LMFNALTRITAGVLTDPVSITETCSARST
jgi:hypothetical protein